MRYLLICIFFECLLVPYKSKGYEFDTSKLTYLIKSIILFDNASLYNSKGYDSFMSIKNDIHYNYLYSTGFSDNYIFIIIFQNNEYFPPKIKDTNLLVSNKQILQCAMILAYDLSTDQYYRLKGFRHNDFKIFKQANKIRRIRKYNIKYIDLKCLNKCYGRRYFKRKKGDCKTSCFERDGNLFTIHDNFKY